MTNATGNCGLVTFIENILTGKFHFLCSENWINLIAIPPKSLTSKLPIPNNFLSRFKNKTRVKDEMTRVDQVKFMEDSL